MVQRLIDQSETEFKDFKSWITSRIIPNCYIRKNWCRTNWCRWISKSLYCKYLNKFWPIRGYDLRSANQRLVVELKQFYSNWKELQIDLWSFGVKNDAKGQNGHAWPVFDIAQNLNGSCFSWTFTIIQMIYHNSF